MTELVEGYTAEELGDKISWEGFEYFFLFYLDPTRIQDPQLSAAVHMFKLAYEDICSILDEHGIDYSE